MVSTIAICLGQVAPVYNLALVLIVIALFVRLFNVKNKGKVYLAPWKILFYAIMVYVVEELLTVTNKFGLTLIPRISTAIFEMVIITLFTYALLLQKEWIKKNE